MATWQDLAYDSLHAARELRAANRFRSSVSRSYYAAYAGLTHVLSGCPNIRFTRGRQNPSHEQLPRLISGYLDGPVSAGKHSQDLKHWIRCLRKFREEADYAPRAQIGMREAVNALRIAHAILLRLGM